MILFKFQNEHCFHHYFIEEKYLTFYDFLVVKDNNIRLKYNCIVLQFFFNTFSI